MTTLGFTDNSVKYIYIGDSAGTCWYFWDKENDKAIPIVQKGINCIIQGIELIEREFKGKTSLKVVLTVNAGELYKIQFGLTTWFAKTFLIRLLQLSSVELGSPVTIMTRKGEDGNKVIFGSLLNSYGEAVKKPESFSYANYEDEALLIEHVTEIDKKLHVKFATTVAEQDLDNDPELKNVVENGSVPIPF